MDRRRRLYWDMHDFSQGHGLEVGPLHRPMVQRDDGDVSYVDVMDRPRLVEHYAGDANVPADAIPEIDFFLIDSEGDTSTLTEAVRPGAPFDWVMASHVIEHVPDVIGWLDQLADVVVDGGALVLAVPDRRYCFDIHRPPTTVGQMLAAHHAGDQRPAMASVYDYFSGSVDYDIHALWDGKVPTYDRQIHDLTLAQQKVEATLNGEYVDCHVWLFTPTSFVRQMHELRITGHSSWMVEQLEPTPRGDLEFRVVMRRLPRDADPTASHPEEVLDRSDRPDWLLTEAQGRARIGELQRRVERLERRLADKSRRLERLRREAAGQEAPSGRLRGLYHRLPRPVRGVIAAARARRRR